MKPLQTVLTGLRDIRGVQGSFLLRAAGGGALARDGLEILDDVNLAETARRLENVFGALSSVCPESDEAVLRFDGMCLFTRRDGRVLLGILADATVSLPALRMGSNLVLRKLEGIELPAAEPDRPPAAATGTPMIWRGVPIPRNG
jgi:hypothetical protein